MIIPGHDDIWHRVFPNQEIPREARQPASVDVRLDSRVILYPPDGQVVTIDDRFEIGPGQFILGSTIERVYIPPEYAARVEGKSSWGRRGLTIHVTAGFIDPGFSGHITLEMVNVSPNPIPVPVGCWIAQLSLHRMLYAVKPEHLYKGKYQNADGPEGPKK